jgi:hypothetical protein
VEEESTHALRVSGLFMIHQFSELSNTWWVMTDILCRIDGLCNLTFRQSANDPRHCHLLYSESE